MPNPQLSTLNSRLLPGTSWYKLSVDRQLVRVNDQDSISGYGAVFYSVGDPSTEYWLWEDVVERILPGAFDRALREDDVRSFFNHDVNFILGRTSSGTLKLSIDSVGLRYSVTPSESLIAQHALEAVRRGDVNGSSFMFEVSSANWVEEKIDGHSLWIREITEVSPLYEVGPVCFPAYAGTTAESEGRGARGEGRVIGPAAVPWQQWYKRHITTARRSLQEFRDLRALERIGVNAEARGRRQRKRRAFELRFR